MMKKRPICNGLEMFRLILPALWPPTAVFSVRSVHWGFGHFDNPTMEEVVYQLSNPLKGTENKMVGDYLRYSLAPAGLLAAALLPLSVATCHEKRFRKASDGVGALSFGVTIAALMYLLHRVGVEGYLRNRLTKSDFIRKHYVKPTAGIVSFPKRKRNLIYIYLESIEVTFAEVSSGGALKVNHIPALTSLARQNENFSGDDEKLSGGYVMPGTTWTVGGMFAQTAGLPLRRSFETSFPKDVTGDALLTLGDILENVGYRQVLLIGSDAAFGRRDDYFSQHGNFEIRDYGYAKEAGCIPKDYKESWGMEDEKLFSLAKQTLRELAAGDTPFNLTMLTVDTHMPEGYTCRLCRNDFDSPYANAIACSDRQVASFVEWIQKQDFYQDTTIVLCGDHLTMAKGVCDDIDPSYIRKTYTCIVNPAKARKSTMRRDYTTFDLFPTTLSALGAEISGDRLGLGTDLFSDTATLSERYGYEKEAREVAKNPA